MILKMKNTTKLYVDQLLFDYPNIESEINRVIEEIKYPYNEPDCNSYLPGSNLPSSSLENSVIRIVDSRRLSALKNIKRKIAKVIEEADPLEVEFMERYYFAKPRTKTMPGIAIDMNISDRQCYRLRVSVREKVAIECGLH